MSGADVVLIAVPVGQLAGVLRDAVPALDRDVVITDGGSTKQDVVTAARTGLGKHLPRFVPAHPIAGAERSGVDAARAERLGLINRVVPAAELEPVTLGLARQIAANAPLSIAVMKEQLRILAGAHPMTPQGFERVQGLRRIVYDSEDYREGIRAFKEKRPPVFRGE